jgi:uncharacterized protein
VRQELGGSELCLACGLCCNGTLHTSVAVQPEHARLVRNLGLTVEKIGQELGFCQPCPLHQDDCCSVYPQHPPSCQEFQCALLQKYENGDITLADSLTIVRTAKELHAEGFRAKLAESWDGERGLRGSGAVRQVNAECVLRAATLDVHIKKHFRRPGEASDTDR